MLISYLEVLKGGEEDVYSTTLCISCTNVMFPTPLFNAYKPILLYKWRGVSDARVAGSAKAMAEQMRLEHSAAMREQVS